MKRIIFCTLLACLTFTFISCEEEDDDLQPTVEAVWENQFLFGNTIINGQSLLTTESQTTNTFIRDNVCYQDLPSGPIQTFSFRVYIPSSADVESGFDVNDFIIFFNNTSVVLEDQLGFIGIINIDGIQYSEFSVNGVYSPVDMNRDNFQQLRFGFDMIHRDPDTEEEYNRETKFIEINIDGC